jgi:pimeloyl-ACP methyl ester carboxylesterase
VVLMHGFPDDQRIYARLLPLLSPRRAVTFDFLGYGRSDRSATAGFTPDDHAAQITAVLDALDIHDAVLVGHDASGPDAVFYTLAHPERVAHLALLNTMFGRSDALIMPEMTKMLSEPELGTLADDMIGDPAQRLCSGGVGSGNSTARIPTVWPRSPSSLSSTVTTAKPTRSPPSASGPLNFLPLLTGRTPSSPSRRCAESTRLCRSSSANETITSVPHSPRKSLACLRIRRFTRSNGPAITRNTIGPTPSRPS